MVDWFLKKVLWKLLAWIGKWIWRGIVWCFKDDYAWIPLVLAAALLAVWGILDPQDLWVSVGIPIVAVLLSPLSILIALLAICWVWDQFFPKKKKEEKKKDGT